MSQDPSMNTAILHWATQVAATTTTATTATTATTTNGESPQALAPSAALSSANALMAPAPATTAAAPLNEAATAPSAGAAVPADRVDGDYSWLKEVLATVESPERRVKRLLQQIEELVGVPVHPDFVCTTTDKKTDASAADADQDPEETLLNAIEELSDMVEDINWATEFGLMQGPSRMLALLALALPGTDAKAACFVCTSADVRRGLALVVAHSAQLNEALQQAYAEAHWASVLLPLVASESHQSRASSVLAALLHACSCLCRDNVPNTAMFVQQGGLACLADLLRLESGRSNASAKVLARTLFFLSYLAQTGVSAEEVLRLTCAQVEDGTAADAHDTTTTTTTTSSATIITTTTNHPDAEDGDASAAAAPAHADNEEVQRAAALFLLSAFQKAPEVVKRCVREGMPRRLEQWKQQMQRGEESDYRAELVEAMEKAS